MAIELLALYAATAPPLAEELAGLLDTWQALLRETIDHDAVTEIVELLNSTSPDSSAADFVTALTRLGLQDLVAEPGSSQEGRELERMRAAFHPEGALSASTVQSLGDRARAKGRVMRRRRTVSRASSSTL